MNDTNQHSKTSYLDEHLLLSKQLNHITLELRQAIGMLSKLENLYLPENSEDDIIFWFLLTFYIY